MPANKLTDDKWARIANSWFLNGPPASPSAEDVEHYRAMTPVSALREALVLGCTPAIRAMLARDGSRVTCIDRSQAMLDASYRAIPPHPGERAVVADWLADTCVAEYPVVVGDKVLDNVTVNLWPSFVERLAALTAEGGRLIMRVAPVDPGLRGATFEELLTRWAVLYANGEVPLDAATAGLWEEVLGASTRSVPGLQSATIFADEIAAMAREVVGRPPSVVALYESYNHRFEAVEGRSWTAYTLGNVIDALSAHFSLVEVRHSTDYLAAAHQPLVAFERFPKSPHRRTA